VVSRSAIEQGIAEGVRTGLFGLGDLDDNKPVCRYFREQPTVALAGNEVLISEAVCLEQMEKRESPKPEPTVFTPTEPGDKPAGRGVGGERKGEYGGKDRIKLRFLVPKGKVSSIMGVMNLLQSKFETLEIELRAKDGTITEQDYDDKVKETFRQLGIEVDEE
jgi:hypothetical protein